MNLVILNAAKNHICYNSGAGSDNVAGVVGTSIPSS
jgi:hypothetical protein